MSDAEAVEELAKALHHVESAADSAESESVREESERAFDKLSDHLYAVVEEVGEHGCRDS